MSEQTIQLLAAGMAALTIAAITYVILFPSISGQKKKEQRLAIVTESRSKKIQVKNASEVAASRKKQVSETLKDIEAREKVNNKSVPLRLRLERAGFSPEVKPYYLASAASAMVFTVLALVLFPSHDAYLVYVAAAALIGFFIVPRFILSKLIARRQAKFMLELAGGVEIIVRGVKSGLPLNDCLQLISTECPEPVSSEFRTVVEQQRVGVPLQECLERMAERIPLQETRFFTIVIAIQQQAGGNLAEALGNLANVLRDRQRMALRVKALSAEAKSSAAILGVLPPGVGVLMSVTAPDYIAALFTTKAGNMMIAGCMLWMGIGILIMRKMINFKF